MIGMRHFKVFDVTFTSQVYDCCCEVVDGTAGHHPRGWLYSLACLRHKCCGCVCCHAIQMLPDDIHGLIRTQVLPEAGSSNDDTNIFWLELHSSYSCITI